jgi:hypothetical protein
MLVTAAPAHAMALPFYTRSLRRIERWRNSHFRQTHSPLLIGNDQPMSGYCVSVADIDQ